MQSMQSFLRYWFHQLQNVYIELTFIAPPDSDLYPKTIVKWASLPYRESKPEMVAYVKQMNAQGYGAYFGVTPSASIQPDGKRRSESDVPNITGLWLDLDTEKAGIKYGDAWYALMQSPAPPTIITYTGGGLHAYYRLQRPFGVVNPDRKKRVKNIMKGMARHFEGIGADSAATDLARVLRLPGTVNTKPARNGAACCIYSRNLDTRYTIDELEISFYHAIPRTLPKVKRQAQIDVSGESYPQWITEYIQYGANEGERNQRLYAVARWFNDAGKSQSEAERILGQRASADGLENHEVMATIASAYRAQRGSALPPQQQARLAIRDRRLTR